MITSLSLSIMATRGGSKAAPTLLDKAVRPGATQQKAAPTAPGGTLPITVTPVEGGKAGQPQQVQVPVVPLPEGVQQQKK
jgi:hypothetical protein